VKERLVPDRKTLQIKLFRTPVALPERCQAAIFASTNQFSYDRVGEWDPRDPLFFITCAFVNSGIAANDRRF
jgi:hypothetical protein